MVPRWSFLPKIYGSIPTSEKHLTMTKTKELGSRKVFIEGDPDYSNHFKDLNHILIRLLGSLFSSQALKCNLRHFSIVFDTACKVEMALVLPSEPPEGPKIWWGQHFLTALVYFYTQGLC